MERSEGNGAVNRGRATARAAPALLILSFLLGVSLACRGHDPSTLGAVALSGGATLQGLEGLFLEVRQGDRIHRFAAADFRTSASDLTPHTERINLEDERPIRVTAGLMAGVDTLAVLSTELAARPRFNWFVVIARGTSNPNGGCFNCLGHDSLEIAGAAGERFWLQWGGSGQGVGPY